MQVPPISHLLKFRFSAARETRRPLWAIVKTRAPALKDAVESPIDIERALGIQELRAGFLRHTKRAYRMLPAFDRPRILDIGCGTGLPTMVLAELGLGEIVGIDIDDAALSQLRQRIPDAGLSHRVIAVNVSLYETGIPDQSFEILWAEGVLHSLDPYKSFRECHRLLKPKGFLMIHETIGT
jgi:ubiquinone/menaquinone biosynthesis C-methylase UbiE